MITIENVEVVGWEHAIRGMRNPMNSWAKSDSSYTDEYKVGPRDYELMSKLTNGGPVHAKYRRMIVAYLDITAPLYWWKEFDTYKVGTVANSCSTMHKIHDKEFTIDNFSHEHLESGGLEVLQYIINHLRLARDMFLKTNNKKYWWQMIQLLPSSYNQKRTVMLNYEVLANIYSSRCNTHKLDEWQTLCDWMETLPCSDLIMPKVF